MVQIRTDMGTIGSKGDLGAPVQAAAMTAEATAALTAAGAQTETADSSQTETSALADAPSGNGSAGHSSSGNHDTGVALVNRTKVRVAENRLIIDAIVVRVIEHRTIIDAAVVRIGELDVKQLLLVTRVKELEDMLENFGLVAKN